MAGKERAAVCWMVGEKGMRSSMEGAVAVGRHFLRKVLCQSSAGLKIGEKTARPHLSRTGRYGFVLCSGGKVFFPHVRCLASLTNRLKSFAFASLIDNLLLGIAVGDTELNGASGRYVTRKFFCQLGNHLVNIAETDVCKFG